MYDFECSYFIKNAGHQHGNRGSCVKGTHKIALDTIDSWADDLDKNPVFWLTGVAATGKTTIAQTVSDRLSAKGRLGASFFCSRDSEDWRNPKNIFPTLAFQLSCQYPNYLKEFVPLLHLNYYAQDTRMKELTVEALERSAISTVIVIDALDECENPGEILSVIRDVVSNVRAIKFFITSRREQSIEQEFTEFKPVMLSLDPVWPEEEMRRFFEHSLSKLRDRRGGLDHWPATADLHRLYERAGGVFVHAAEIVGSIDRKFGDPRKRLEDLLKSPVKINSQKTLGLSDPPTRE